MLRQIFLMLFLVFTSALPLEAKFNPDKLYLTNLFLKQGLSQCVVTDIVIDHKGFVWASTFDGLNRFDGSNFKVFRNNPDDVLSIQSSKINRIFADDHFHIFLQTNIGFSIFDTRACATTQQDFVKKNHPLWVAKSDITDCIWLINDKNELLLVDVKTFTVKQKFINKLPTKSRIHDIIQVDNKVFLIYENGEFCCLDIILNRFTQLEIPTKTGLITAANTDKHRNIILSGNDCGLIQFDTKTFQFTPLVFQSTALKIIGINKILFNHETNCLLLSSYGQGLFIYDYDTEKLSQLKKNEPPLSISANYPISMACNKEGIILLGYDGMGIDLINPNVKKFVTLTKEDINDHETLKFVRKIVEGDDGNVFIGTSGSGLVRYNQITKKMEFFHMKNKLTKGENFVIEMCRLGNQLWLGYNGGGIEVLDIHSMKSIHNIYVGDGKQEISNGIIWSMMPDQNYMWVGTRENGLNKIDKNTFEVQQFDGAQFPIVSFNGIRCLQKLGSHQIMVGTEKGLYIFSEDKKTLDLVFPNTLDVSHASLAGIKSIHFDKFKRTWLGTDGGGIVVLDRNFQILKKLNTNNLLKNNVVYGILSENDSTFWISTNWGLSRISWNKNSFQKNGIFHVENFDESNGLQSNEFNTGAYTRFEDGSLVFGGLNGLNIFQGKDIQSNTTFPEVYINEFRVYQKDFNDRDDISFTRNIALKHNENSISISFNALHFTKPDHLKYQYRLLGNDEKWVNSGTRNYISYTNLKSGSYEFQVRASNNDGIWNPNYTSLKIEIATPFYSTWWFILLCLSTLSYLVYAIYKYRIDQIKEKEILRIQYNKELAEVEMKALRAQINPHFIFNSLNSINNYILKNDTKMASRYLVKFSQLIRSILNNSSNPYITLQEELQTIELYMLIEGMRFNNQFSYVIETESELNTGSILIPSLLLQPYVENAIWHGLLHKDGEKLIKISISEFNTEVVKIIIEDNGVGRRKSEEIEQKPKHRKSFGMQLGESRLRLMNQEHEAHAIVNVIDLVDDKQSGLGTKIEIHIPIKKITTPNIHLN